MHYRVLSRFLAAAFFALTPFFPASAQVVEGFGRDVPLSFALGQVVPKTYKVEFGPGVDRESRVSWRGGRDWQAVLRDMVASRGWTADVSGDQVQIHGAAVSFGGSTPVATGHASAGLSIAPVRTPAAPAVAAPAISDMDRTTEQSAQRPMPVAGPVGRPALPGMDDAPVAQPASSQPAPARPVSGASPSASHPVSPLVSHEETSETWVAPTGALLRETLTDWSEKAGWTVVYNTTFEYPIQAGARFSGHFVDAAANLIKSFSAARPMVRATFYRGNKVVVISNSIDEPR